MKPMRSKLLSLVALCAALGAAGFAPAGAEPPAELYRIRIHNVQGGSVEVSANRGADYFLIGHVVQGATKLSPGFAASRWAHVGAVAAVAVHGLRIKVRAALPADPNNGSDSMLISVVPKDQRQVPKGYGSYLPGGSGIYTDIPAGEGIFRNLAPFVGNPAYLERNAQLVPFPDDYVPGPDDFIVIQVIPPPVSPREIVFENWTGGSVTARFEGREPQPIARVVRPVLGVGRYDATSYTGVGHINTNHCGVITISTAPTSGTLLPEGEGSERRGGIQIEPSSHAEAVSKNAPQVLVVEPLEGQGPLEGQPPLFSGYIPLSWDRTSAANSSVAEVKLDNGPWEPFPEFLGRQDDAFTADALNRYFKARGMDRHITSGVTHLRILLPQIGAAQVARVLAAYPANPHPVNPTILAGKPAATAPMPVANLSQGGLPVLPPVGGGPGPVAPDPPAPAGTGEGGAAPGTPPAPGSVLHLPPPGTPPPPPNAGGTGAAPPQTPLPPQEPAHVKGMVTLSVALKNLEDPTRIALLGVYVDDQLVAMMNTAPFRHNLDTRTLANGKHEVELRAVDKQGTILAQRKSTIIVENPPPPPPPPAPASGEAGTS